MQIKGDYNFQPKGLKSRQGWSSRGYLPHFDGGEILQFVTFRLADSMPQDVLEKLRREVADENGEIRFRKNVERYLDSGYGSCFLKRQDIAKLVRDGLFFHAGKKYELIAWVIMPNHVHILIRPLPDVELDAIMHSIKSYMAHEANKILGRSGQFWQPESFDRYIRNQKHFLSVIRYIENNPVKARLCLRPEDWPYSSATGA
ncbi:MAG: REP-associated tyrosine transposase [Pyrinomonadaceae bacterium]